MKDTVKIDAIRAFHDNYFWLLSNQNQAVVVDPGDANPVRKHLKQHKLELAAILVTHHHYDHVGGISALLSDYNCPVYGPASETIPELSHPLAQGDRVSLATLDLEFSIIDVPGHTAGHIAYFANDNNPPLLFCGDTLFSAGCGRLFEGTAQQMHQSLSKLAALPPATQVYAAHEYTLSNLAFAQAVEPDNTDIQAYQASVSDTLKKGGISLPSTIDQELRVNPFMRCEQPTVVAAASIYQQAPVAAGEQTLAAIRKWKDGF